jgi:chemotaxis protein methyltransferase CheR
VKGLDLTPQLFAIFSSLIEDACGVHYGVKDRDLLATKLASHAEDLGHDSLLDYYYRLRYDDTAGDEVRRLVEALVVHETYFFRELPPLRYLAEKYLPQVVAARGRARVWSAACATGEEPFTLAMLLDDQGILDKVDIIATDISRAALEQATKGRHGRRALREPFPEDLASRYLDKSTAGVSLVSRIRDAVQFSQQNLLEDTSRIGTCDVILCRNVFIYFRDDQVARIIMRLANQLSRDGLLVVGVSESLLRFGTSLRCEERDGSFFYRVVK